MDNGAVLSPAQMKTMNVVVWCCPTRDCPEYYGATGMNDLGQSFSGPKVENRAELRQKTGSSYTRSRADCPTCQIRLGRRVQRVPVQMEVSLPMVEPKLTELPAI